MKPTPAPNRARRKALAMLSGLGLVAASRQVVAQPAWSGREPRVPDVVLLDHEAREVALRPLLAEGPVALNFIYTGCSSFCPPQTAIFRELQRLLEQRPIAKARLISLSIDPLGDSPEALRRYAQQFDARLGDQAGWHMLTGGAKRAREIRDALIAFGAHADSLAAHPAQIWIANAPRSRWMRTLGLVGAPQLLDWLRASSES